MTSSPRFATKTMPLRKIVPLMSSQERVECNQSATSSKTQLQTQKQRFGTRKMTTRLRIGKHLPSDLPNAHTMLSILIDKGVKQMERRRYEQAQKYLHRALQMSGNKGAFDPKNFKTNRPHLVDKEPSTVPAKYAEEESPSSNNTINNLNRHRYEYDEGMDWGCRKPLRIDNSLEGKIVDGTILFNLGRISHKQGQFDDAGELYNRALQAIKGCTQDHASIKFTILFGIGHLQYVRGEHAKSDRTYTKCLSFSRTEFGNDSLHVAACLNCIGVLHYIRSNGDVKAALKALQSSLEIREKQRFEDTVDIGTTYNNIGRIYFQQKRYEKAIESYQKALRIRLAYQGESVDCGAVYFNIAQVHHQRGKTFEALHYYEEFLRLAKENFGPWHRDVCIVSTCIGQVLQERKEYERAKKAFQDALAAGRAALGPIHPEIAITLNKLGNLYYESGDLQAALNAYQHGLTVELAVLEPDNLNIRVTYTNIAEIHKQRKEFEQALEYYDKVLDLQRKYDCDSLDIATTLSSIGFVCAQKGNLGRSMDSHQESLRLRKEASGDIDEGVATSLTHLAMVFVKTHASDVALGVLEEAYRIRVALKSDNKDMAFLLYQMGLIHHTSGSHDIALKFYLETARMEKQTLGLTHRDLSITYYNLAQIYFQRGDMDLALTNFSEALEIERECFGKDHQTCARTLNEMGNIHLQLGNIDEVMNCYSEALRIYDNTGDDRELVIYGQALWQFELVQPAAAPMA